ncbi:MAG: glycoside hydrolase family 3 C-terminal domain-containing protein [Bacteroidia bacterium]
MVIGLANPLLAQVNTNGVDSFTIKTNAIMSQMTLQQKVNEMSGNGIEKLAISYLLTKRINPVKFGGNKKLGIPEGVFFDGPRGIGSYKGATAFPVTSARAASWDVDLEKRVGLAMSEECRALGGNYLGAVCVNLLRHPANGRAQEAYSEDSFLTGEMGVALVTGIQTNNVQACVKHFALNSMENNRFGGNIKIDERSLHEVYLPHFKKIVQSGVASVMSAYNKVNGEYCGENQNLLVDILRKEWGFKGYVSSDWQYGLMDAEKGINAQMNIEMPSANCYKYKTIQQLLGANKITINQIDSLIFPIIRTKLVFEAAGSHQKFSKDLLGCKEHIQLALEVAEKSIVLLKNESNVLPLSKDLKSIAIVGSLAEYKQTGDRGSSRVLPKYIVTLKDALKNYCPSSTKILTAKNSDTDKLKSICSEAEVVIVMAGYTYKDEGEYISMGTMRDSTNPDKKSIPTSLGLFGLGGDRKYIHLHQTDIDVIKLVASLNKKVIVCLVGGSAITVEEWYVQVPAVLHTFYSGMEGGNALAKILFGDVNPSGKLPFTVPVDADDLPEFNSFAKEVTYGYYHGYTLFGKTQKPVRFSFGYGLSYTTFQLSDLKIENKNLSENDTLHVSVKIKNTGNRTGAEVVQLYIGFENSKIDRAKKLLRAFSKIELLPNEERIINFAVLPSDLAYYNAEKHGWEIEKINYKVLVGNQSSDSNFQKKEFEIR